MMSEVIVATNAEIEAPAPAPAPAPDSVIPGGITNRLTTAHVLTTYVHLGECLERQREHYDRLLTVPPQQMWGVLGNIREWAVNAMGMVDRLQRGNK